MTVSHFRRFVETIDAAATPKDGLTEATVALEAEPASEFSRCLRGLCLDIAPTLRAADLPGWRIVPDEELPLGRGLLDRCRHYLNAEEETEFSTALLAQVLLRADTRSLAQVRMLLNEHNVLPAPFTVRDVAEAARRLTAGVAQSYALPVDGTSVDGFGELDPGAEASDFERSVEGAVRHWAALPAEIRGGDVATSALLVRAAVGRGADQRISRWLQSAGLNRVDFARAVVEEEPADEPVAGVSASREAARVWAAARWLGSLGNQALSTDRVILASLAVPSSYLAAHLVALFGPAVNLPLLYLRTAAPPGISLAEASWLVGQGDANARPAPTDAVYDLCVPRVSRLLAASAQSPGFDAVERMRVFLRHNRPGDDFPVPNHAFLTGDCVGVLGLLRGAARAEAEQRAESGEAWRTAAAVPLTRAYLAGLLDGLRPAARLPNGKECWSYARYATLLASDLSAAYVARRQLAACQLGPLGLRTLPAFGPSSRQIGRLVEREPDLALDTVGVAHCLESGVQPFPPYPVSDTARLVIGGSDGHFVLAVVTREARYRTEFDLPEGRAVLAWRAMRKPAVAGEWEAVAAAMGETAALLGLDAAAPLLEDADVEFTAVRPFDAFMVDHMIRAVANPRSVVHRVFGARANTWAGDLGLLRRAGRMALVVDDPSRSLASAAYEAPAVAQILDATLIGGRGVRRASVLRMLEAAPDRPAFIHFTGHGTTGLVGPTGDISSGVLAASREAIGVASIAGANMPRVLIASTCDAGSTPPVSQASAWSTAAISHGASYSLASGLPLNDTAALVFTILMARQWAQGAHLEHAVAAVSRLGRSPASLLAAWHQYAPETAVRRIGNAWIRERSASEIAQCMGAFCLSSA